MTKIEQLQNFIKNNKLQFTEGRRNSDLVVLCGYGLYIKASNEEIWESIPGIKRVEASVLELEEEFDRVYDYAETNNYGKWWEKEANRKQYKL